MTAGKLSTNYVIASWHIIGECEMAITSVSNSMLSGQYLYFATYLIPVCIIRAVQTILAIIACDFFFQSDFHSIKVLRDTMANGWESNPLHLKDPM